MPVFLCHLLLASANRNGMQQLSLSPALLHFPSFCIPFILYAALQEMEKSMHEWHGGKGKGFTRVALMKIAGIISWGQRIYKAGRKAYNILTPLKGNIITTSSARRQRSQKAEESILHDRSYNMRKCYVSYSFHGFSCSCERKHHAACLLLLLLFNMQFLELMNIPLQLHSCSSTSCRASIY